ncbi:MAG: hypothetical protein E6Q68_03255 [Polynucleobacter sp.]|nr:MAG: hypothetical protein E6Q68_03255 [Polynucleobacter sp.]
MKKMEFVFILGLLIAPMIACQQDQKTPEPIVIEKEVIKEAKCALPEILEVPNPLCTYNECDIKAFLMNFKTKEVLFFDPSKKRMQKIKFTSPERMIAYYAELSSIGFYTM